MSSQKNYNSNINIIWFFIGCCFFAVAFLCQGCSSEMAGMNELSGEPRIVLDTTSYDLGTIKPGSKKIAVFRFRSAGSKPLQITDVKRCCGSVAKLDKKELAPGESGTLTATYQAGHKQRIFRRKVTLFTNDPENSQIDLVFSGKVMQTLEWTPRQFELSVDNEKKGCPDITIRSVDGTPFSIKGFSATGNCLTAEFDPNRKAEEFTLKPVVDMGKLGAMPVSDGKVRIDLSHKDYEVIHLSFNVLQAFEVIPRAIFAAETPVDKPVLRTLKLQDNRAGSNEEISSRIMSVTSEKGSLIEVRGLKKVGKGCEIELEIWPFKCTLNETHWTDKLLIKMKGGRELSVPVYMFYESQKLSSTAGSS